MVEGYDNYEFRREDTKSKVDEKTWSSITTFKQVIHPRHSPKRWIGGNLQCQLWLGEGAPRRCYRSHTSALSGWCLLVPLSAKMPAEIAFFAFVWLKGSEL